MKRKKIGIMGGTFDPIHIGHLILGETACQQFELDGILFMPAGNPPHKQHREGRATDEQRVRMVELAIRDNPHFSISLQEMNADGYTYTYRTLEAMCRENPDTDFYFIIGADSLVDFDTWKKPERIAKACSLVVATRNSINPELFDRMIQNKETVYGGNFLKLDSPNLDISSHHLRGMIREGVSVKYYIPDPVIEMIQKEKIYKSADS